jgi:1,4-alpha-glucan branching enzyme
MILDSARYWVTHMHVDGFRFDLASILARDEIGRLLENPPVLRGLTPRNLAVMVLTVETNLKSDFPIEVATFQKQVGHIKLEVRTTADFHDRFIVIAMARSFTTSALRSKMPANGRS